MSVRFCWFNVFFKPPTSLLIICLDVLAIIESKVLKFLTTTIELSICRFNSVNVCFICLGVVSYIYVYSCYIFLMNWTCHQYIMACASCNSLWFKVILCDISVTTADQFWLVFAWDSLSHTLTFNICVSCDLKWVFVDSIYYPWLPENSQYLSNKFLSCLIQHHIFTTSNQGIVICACLYPDSLKMRLKVKKKK